jgi:hypothetical protein
MLGVSGSVTRSPWSTRRGGRLRSTATLESGAVAPPLVDTMTTAIAADLLRCSATGHTPLWLTFR